MSTPHDRDTRLDQWLRRADGAAIVVTASCLDAETAAAWFSGGLTDHALARAQAHTANCARCQALLRTLADAEAAAAQVAGDEAGAPVQPWWSARRGWLLPVGAAATLVFAVMVWTRTPQPPAADTFAGTASSAPEGAAPGRGAIADTPQASSEPGTAATANEAPASAAPTAAARSAETSEPEARRAEEPASRLQQRARAAEAVGAPSAVAPAPQALADAANATAKVAAPMVGLTAAPPPAAPAPVAAPAAAPRVAVSGALAEQAVVASELGPAGQSARWRLASGRLEVRRGTTWQAVPGMDGPWTAGSAPVDDVCWIVGPGGVVARTADGTTWNRPTLPVSDDLMSVRATSATAATVTTRGGTSLSTTDAGATWR